MPFVREAVRRHGRDADRLRYCLSQQATYAAAVGAGAAREAHQAVLGR